ncbi:unnamed protein product [Caenorhabditis sp. 36 PRJEB53466]|nr:unnamed protein product [Caenorhabditis sp. 36 PRJEB53466]
MSGKANSGVIRFQIENFADLNEKKEHNEVEIGNVKWILGAFPTTSDKTNNVKHLGVYLKCENSNRSNLWSVNASNWEEAICYDNRFILDTHAVLEAYITVSDVVGIHEKLLETFDASKEHLTDVVLVVEGKKVHVGMQILALYSKFFANLFYTNFVENGKDEIELKEVVHSEFIDLLNLIYPSHQIVDAKTVPHLLKLADRFGVLTVIEKCENYLISNVEIHTVDKLKYAESYKLSKLQDHCLAALKASSEVTALANHENYGNLGDVTYNVLLQTIVKLYDSGV